MPITKWFRGQRRSRTNSTGYDAMWSFTETTNIKQKPRSKTVTEHPRQSQSYGSGFRAMFARVGFRASEQFTTDTTLSETPAEYQRYTMYQAKPRRRFTDYGLSQYNPSGGAHWGDNMTPSMNGTGLYGFGGSQQTIQFTPVSHPSIIFIDCPP